MATIKAGGKPTMEIYRPPNVRTSPPKLNVHAKEFTMNELQGSKSSANIGVNFEAMMPLHHLQHSKSSGNVLRHITPPLIPLMPAGHLHLPLLHSASSSHILNHLPRIGFHHYPNEILSPPAPVFSGHNQPSNYNNWNNNHHYTPPINSLKRSKSLGAHDSRNLKLDNLAQEEVDLLGIFSGDDQNNLKLALEDPNQLSSRTVMDIVKIIMERVVEGIKYCEAGAKICMAIIDKEKNYTFLESLLNTCQQWYQERDKILRGMKAGDGTKFTAFMWFLTEMCGQLKRHQIKEQYESLQPELVMLSVLAKCCQACVSLPIKCLAETECLFFVLTSIGRDLEAELPQQLEQLLASVRDGFLASVGAPAVRRTLLQLIELHASNWQLPGSSVLYYYPRSK